MVGAYPLSGLQTTTTQEASSLAAANTQKNNYINKPIVPASHHPVDKMTESLPSPHKGAAIAKAYIYETEPWLKTPAGPDEAHTRWTRTKEHYLETKTIESMFHLSWMKLSYDQFKKNLQYINPDLALKPFSFTLGNDGNLKIMDTAKTLTIAEQEWLKESLNKFEDLRHLTNSHAVITMTLVDHDTQNLGGGYMLNYENFQRVIDYGKLLDGPSDAYHTLLLQTIRENAERSTNSIDTHA
jgi:hypothetical protein